MNKELTKAEEQVMEHLWIMGEAYVKEIVERFPDPPPAYTTVSTIIRILEKKGFVTHRAYGNTHRYAPLITKEKYSEFCTSSLVKRYFSNSISNLVSFFASRNDLSIEELEEIQRMINNEINQKKKS